MTTLFIIPLLIFYGIPIYFLVFQNQVAISEFIFWSAILSSASICIVGATVLGIGGSGTLLVVSLAVIWTFIVALAVRLKRLRFELINFGKGQTGILLVGLFTIGLIALPSYRVDGTLGTPLRIGPDVIGNAVASNTLAKNVTLNQIQAEILESIQVDSLNEAFKYENHLVYESLNLTTQIRTEFLLAGMRWGLPLTAVVPSRILGTNFVWQILPTLSLFALFISFIGGVIIGHNLKRKSSVSAAYGLLLVLSPTLLNGYYEGGTSQVWSYQFVVALIVVFTSHTRPTTRLFLSASILSAALITYADVWVMLVAVILIWTALEIFRKRSIKEINNSLFWAIPLSLIVSNFFGLRFLQWFLRRLGDAAGGGWSMPHWMSPVEIYGIVNSYNQNFVSGEIPRSELLALANQVLNPILIAVILTFLVYSNRKIANVAISSIALISLVYLKTRYVDNASNYQLFKAAGCMVPLLWLPMVTFEHERNESTARFGSVITKMSVVLAFIATVNYLITYRSDSQLIDQSLANSLSRPANQKIFSEINLIAPLNGQSVAMSAVVDLNWFGRGAFGKIEGSIVDANRPLFLLIREHDCEDWQCIKDVEQHHIIKINKRTQLVKLSEDSEELVDIDQGPEAGAALLRIVRELVIKKNGPVLNSSFIPMKS